MTVHITLTKSLLHSVLSISDELRDGEVPEGPGAARQAGTVRLCRLCVLHRRRRHVRRRHYPRLVDQGGDQGGGSISGRHTLGADFFG